MSYIGRNPGGNIYNIEEIKIVNAGLSRKEDFLKSLNSA